MTARFRPEDIKRMMGHLRTMAAPFGIAFADRPFLSNSRMALLAAEFAREEGRFQKFHDAVFAAYFSHGLDIGDMQVLLQIASDIGMDSDAMEAAIKSGKHLPLLEAAMEDSLRFGVTGVPTFIINEKSSIVGAQSLDAFRKMFVKGET